jgi:hypothetical protein
MDKGYSVSAQPFFNLHISFIVSRASKNQDSTKIYFHQNFLSILFHHHSIHTCPVSITASIACSCRLQQSAWLHVINSRLLASWIFLQTPCPEMINGTRWSVRCAWAGRCYAAPYYANTKRLSVSLPSN